MKPPLFDIHVLRQSAAEDRAEKLFFRNAVLWSLAAHCFFWLALYVQSVYAPFEGPPAIEIDLTKPFRIGGNPLLKPGGGTALNIPKEKEGPPALKEENEPEPPKQIEEVKPREWVLPGPDTQETVKPQAEPKPAGSSELGMPGGSGEGWSGSGGGFGGGDGQGGGVPLTRLPKLLNVREISRLLRKYYPEIERAAGREGVVIVDLHIGVDGRVSSVDIADTAGQYFDEAATKLCKKMLFSPAMAQTAPVAVKLRQSIGFKLED